MNTNVSTTDDAPPIVLVFHGSHRSTFRHEAQHLLELVRRELPKRLVRSAFLATKDPGPIDVLDELARAGALQIVLIPLFLFTGAHVEHDIPSCVDSIRHRHPQLTVTVKQHIGATLEFARLVVSRVTG